MNIKKEGLCGYKVVFLGAVAFISACTTVNFKEPVTSYSTAMSTSGTIFSKYYAGQNDILRKIYFTNLKYNKDTKIGEIDEQGFKTPLYFYYSPEAMRARLDTLKLVSAYGNKLAVLAGADSPQRISDNTASIISDSATVVTQLEALQGAGSSVNAQYLASAKTLTSALVKMYYENKQSDAVKQEIVSGHDAVNKIFELIRDDLNGFSNDLSSRYKNQLGHLVLYYNKDLNLKASGGVVQTSKGSAKAAAPASTPTPLTDSQRIDLLNQIQTTASLYESSVMGRPDDVVTAMIQANDEIYKYAQDPSGGDSLVALNAALESFNYRLKPFVDFYTETHAR